MIGRREDHTGLICALAIILSLVSASGSLGSMVDLGVFANGLEFDHLRIDPLQVAATGSSQDASDLDETTATWMVGFPAGLQSESASKTKGARSWLDGMIGLEIDTPSTDLNGDGMIPDGGSMLDLENTFGFVRLSSSLSYELFVAGLDLTEVFHWGDGR